MLQVWQPNTLPLPYPVVDLAPSAAIPGAVPPSAPIETMSPILVDVNDNFPKAQVAKYFLHQRYGFIVDAKGREIYFNLNELDFVGAKGKADLKVGIPVGYDVSWTSHGLHVKKLKIY